MPTLDDARAGDGRGRAACGIPVDLPFRASASTTARAETDDDVDFIDDVLDGLRANVLRRRIPATTPRERLNAYLTAYAHDVLKRCAMETSCGVKSEAMKRSMDDARGRFACPGDADFGDFASLLRPPESDEERETFRVFVKKCRVELARRLVERCYDANTGERDKFWMAFAKRRFMNR